MKTLITDIIKAINTGATASEVNTLFAQFIADFNYTDLATVIDYKIEILKRYYLHRSNLDVVYADLSFQADVASRDSVITPRSLKALQAQFEGNTSWSAIIVSNTKDENNEDIFKVFTATEMLAFADAVTLSVETQFFTRKTHCNNVQVLSTVQEVIDYTW